MIKQLASASWYGRTIVELLSNSARNRDLVSTYTYLDPSSWGTNTFTRHLLGVRGRGGELDPTNVKESRDVVEINQLKNEVRGERV
jgi:hypothetical protein